MRIAVGLELNNEGRALAWALDYPGCFAYGTEGPEAVIALARSLSAYETWSNRHAGHDWLQLGDYDLRIVDTWVVYTINEQFEPEEAGYAVNAWFKSDWKPLNEEEVQRGLDLLRWSRDDLLQLLQSLSTKQLDREYPGERWNIRGIFKHIANAEWWYLDRLGLAGLRREQLPQEIITRLSLVRERLNAVLPQLTGQNLVVGTDGEFWSPRKLLRRALWHSIDHYQHILKLSQIP
jgi:hypothetical protein